ncbi:unnamed protein product [Durusdinium trenchii]|uniref:Uncharacterized protein n=1 Tax=Durusdinium trenchii TaxID=1381693 RepID=A0ABP0SCZ6_9DINO
MSRYGLDEGVQQLTRAAELGLPEALVNQGFSYLIGPGIQEDQEAEGLKLLELAAQSGDPVRSSVRIHMVFPSSRAANSLLSFS